jgi:hypothetical protein
MQPSGGEHGVHVPVRSGVNVLFRAWPFSRGFGRGRGMADSRLVKHYRPDDGGGDCGRDDHVGRAFGFIRKLDQESAKGASMTSTLVDVAQSLSPPDSRYGYL